MFSQKAARTLFVTVKSLAFVGLTLARELPVRDTQQVSFLWLSGHSPTGVPRLCAVSEKSNRRPWWLLTAEPSRT